MIPLPWALDVELAERVLSDLMRPEKLVSLDEEFQELMLTLANAEGKADPDFEFKPFRPQSPMARIEEKLPVLIPVVEEVVKEVEVESVVDEFIDEPIVEIEEEVEVVTDRFEPSKSVLDLFGFDENDMELDQLLQPPLDVRVQRLARIAMILEEGDSGPHRALYGRLPAIAKKLESWTAERLSRRHASSGQGLLKDAKALGERLADIPGPGAAMPLGLDQFELPKPEDLEGLTAAIKRLEKSVMLPSAMIQTPTAVES